jgi:hypothetical protein
MDNIGSELFESMVEASSGLYYTVGERAGHSQVSLWREWPQQVLLHGSYESFLILSQSTSHTET